MSFLADSPKENPLVELIKTHATRQDVVQARDASQEFNVSLLLSAPQAQSLQEAIGWTFASFYKKEENRPYFQITEAATLNAENFTKLFDVATMEVTIWLNETLLSNEPEKQFVGLAHEVERHAFPFYDLFLQIKQYQATKDEELKDGMGLEIFSEKYAPSKQHIEPELAARTTVSVLSMICEQISKQELTKEQPLEALLLASNALPSRILLQLYTDTIMKNVPRQDFEQKYTALSSEVLTRCDPNIVTKLLQRFRQMG